MNIRIQKIRKMLKAMITEESYLATIFVGENVSDSLKEELTKELVEDYPNVEFDISRGDQPVYDFIVGIE